MAVSIKRRVALKGQSRSKFCGEPIKRGSKTLCLRLAGHKKAHRATTMRTAKPSSTVEQLEAVVGQTIKVDGVEVVEVTPDDVVVAKALATVVKQVRSRRSAKRRPLSKAAAGKLAQAVEDGTISASAALSRVAASQRGKVNRPVRVK